jgi:hypothetical protein
MESKFSITGTHPGSFQVSKLNAINCLLTLSENLWELLQEYEGSVVDSILYDASQV